MAALVLGAVGGYFFGPIGFLAGEALGNLLFPQKQEGPRLKDLHLQNSEYGQPIPECYGIVRIAGQVMWQTDLKEHKHTSGGKGGPEVTTYSYSASFACLICEGIVAGGLRRIWADGTLIYDINGGTDGSGAPTSLPCTFYEGDETQLADPTMEAELGTGNVPAFRGIAYVVFDDWDLSDYGNRIPNLNFEIAMKGGAETPIFRAAEYHNEPHNDYGQERWFFRWVGGLVGSATPVITKWAFDGSDIRIKQQNSGTVFTYANPSLVANGTDSLGADDHYPDEVSIVGGGDYWCGVGTYVYADLSTTDLWRFYGSAAYEKVDPINPCVGAGTVSFSSGGTAFPPTASVNFAYLAGVTVGEYVQSVVLTQDGTAAFIMTHPSNPNAAPTKWYRVVDGTVDQSGTISPNNFPGQVAGRTTIPSNPQATACFENNREVCWVALPNSGTLGPHGGGAELFRIDYNTGIMSYDSTAGVCYALDPGYARTGIPNFSAVFSTSCIIPEEGWFGVSIGISLVLFTRLAGTAPTYLYEIVGDQSDRAGLDISEYDVTDLTPEVRGYIMGKRADCRSAIQPLMQGFFFDAVERAGVVTFIRRGKPSALTIPSDDLAAYPDGDTPPAVVELKRAQEVDLPSILNVTYLDVDFAYQNGTQQARRQVTQSQATSDIELPIVFTAAEARAVAWILLLSAWLERESFTLRLPRKYADSEPTDVITAGGYMMRFGRKRDSANGVIEFEGVRTSEAVYVAAPTATTGSGGTTPPVAPADQATQLLLLALPLISDGDDGAAFYAAMAGATDDTWRGANLYRSSDNGSTWTQVASLGIGTVMGTASDALPDFEGGNVFDEASTVTVVMGPGGGELSSSDRAGVMGGANKALVGNEIVQFRNATLTAPNTYKLSGLLRGRRGTDWHIGEHVVSERFVLLSGVVPVYDPVSFRGQLLQYRAVTFGGAIASAKTYTFADVGSTLQPYAPVHLAGGINASDDIIINWTRRTRIGGQWVNFSDVPLSEASELYVLQVWDATYTVCARVVTGLTSPTFTYTAAMQTTDFGAHQQTVYITVAQIGSYGAGVQAAAAIAGGGASVDAPLSPKTPYNTKPPPAPPVTNCSALTGTVTTVNVTWGSSASYFTPTDFGVDDAWVFKIVVPGSPGAYVLNITGAEYNGPPTQRDSIVGASPCAVVPLSPGMQGTGDLGFSYSFYAGLNPDAKQFHLQPGQTIYITVTTRGTSEMIANVTFLAKPL